MWNAWSEDQGLGVAIHANHMLGTDCRLRVLLPNPEWHHHLKLAIHPCMINLLMRNLFVLPCCVLFGCLIGVIKRTNNVSDPGWCSGKKGREYDYY